MAWNYSNTSVQTTLAAPVAPGDTSISIVDATGLPVSFPFSYILDYNLSTVEIVTVTNVVGSSLTVTRGQDGTSAQSHAAGGPCVHGVVARDLSDPQNHIAATSNVHGTGVGASVVGTNTAQTLTNKTISGSSNTISNIADTSILTLSATKITGSFNSVTSVGAVAVSGGSVAVTRSTGSNAAFDAQITGDTNPRGRIQADGTHLWGPGNVAPDVTLTRNNGSTTGVLSLNTELDQVVASTTYDYLNGRVTGDTNERFAVHSDGKIRWGAGAAATDTTLTRTNSRELTSNAAFLLSTSSGTNDLIKVSIDGDTNARWFARGDGRLKWGDGTNSSDTFLYRNGVGILKTEGDVQFASGVNVDVGAWLTYTPTFTASTTNPTVGNGSLTGRYIYLNKHTVQAIFKFVGGSTSTKGSGAYTFSLPITAAASDGNGAVGSLRALDAGVATRVGVVSLVSSTTVQGSFHNDGSAFSASDLTGTFNGCTIYFSLVYEV